MIPGLNTDVRYKGKTFHIQTEDSGLENPVLITHVFLGGTILGSEKQSYQEAVGRDDMEAHVRELMRAQHRAMYKALLDGRYDELARRPQVTRKTEIRKADVRSIPLASRTPGMGVLHGGRVSAPPALSPPETTMDGPLQQRPATVPPPAVEEPELLDAVAVEELAPHGTGVLLPFPTDLTGGRRLPDVMLAYLLEDPDEG